MGGNERHSVLRAARLERGLTQAALARQADVSRQALSAIEAGVYQPTVGVALRLSRALGRSVEQLFGGDLEGGFERLSAVMLEPQPEAQATPPARRSGLYLARVGGRIVGATRPAANLKLLPAAGVIERVASHGSKAQVLAFRSADEIDSTVLIAGCDPAGTLLEEHVERLPGKVRAVCLERSSLAALRALRAGLVHCAGVHLRNSAVEQAGGLCTESGSDFNFDVVRQELGDEPLAMVHFARWELGLAVRAGNPVQIREPADAAQPGVRLALREPGSGARQALEQALAQSGLDLACCAENAVEVRTHLEAAAAVAQGRADAAATLKVAAEAFGLDFVTLRQERYDLVVTKQALGETPVRVVIDALNSSRFAREVSSICGYDTSAMGSVVEHS
jgi:putative molybdopterin biosynthesis protein